MGTGLDASEQVMQAREIPQELVDIVDEAAGRKHSRDGIVLETLARVLTRYDELIGERIRETAYGNQHWEDPRTDRW